MLHHSISGVIMPGSYLVIIHGDVEPELVWYVDEESRDAAAIRHKRENGDEDGLFKLDFEFDGEEDHPVMTSYSNGFFWDALEDDEV
jgi:hypothetical protein